MVLEVAGDLAVIGTDGNGGGGVEVVPRALIAEPGRAVPRAPVRQAQFRVIGARQPDGTAATLPGVTRPGVVALLTRPRNRVCLPGGLAAPRIEGLNEAPDAELAA